jgi:ribosomal protein S7
MSKVLQNVQKKLFNRVEKNLLYNSVWFQKLVANLTFGGKREQIETLIFSVFKIMRYRFKLQGYFWFFHIIELLRPVVDLYPRKIARELRYIPIPIRTTRSYKLGIKWLSNHIKARNELTFRDRFINEFVGYTMSGDTRMFSFLKERHKHILDNRVFSHFRWF